MKRMAFLALAIASFTSLWAQSKFPDGFLAEENRPDAYVWLPEPPKLTGADFTYDFYYYQWGRLKRDEGGVGEMALKDESAPLNEVFGETLDVPLDEVHMPETLLLLQRAVTDANDVNKKVKDRYERKRPFAQFNEPSLKPEEDDVEANTFSYPSGHSSRGWMSALVLATVDPEKAEELFLRARLYALNRVICGHHWKTDIDASMMLSAGLFATIVCTEEYQAQLVKARAEYNAIKSGTDAKAPKVEHRTSGPAYAIDGTQATEATHGIVIQNGQKTIWK